MDHDVYVLASRLEEDFPCVSSTTSSDVWYIDIGAFAHMTGIRDYFSDYQEEQMNFKITMGNKAKFTPIGRGTVVFQTEAGNGIRVTNVLHVPGLGMNLLSVSQLQNRGYHVYFIGNRVYVKDPSWKKKTQIWVRSNKLYKLQHDSPRALVGSVDETDLNELWHRRMGHWELSKTLSQVFQRWALNGMMSAKAAYQRSNNRAKGVLDLIHIYLWTDVH